jgi:hypothetical protein
MSNIQYLRVCPKCGRDVFHSTRKLMLTAIRKGCTCRPCSVRRNEQHPNFGKHHPIEVRNKISISEKGKRTSYESRMKMSDSHRGMITSDETKKKHRMRTLENVKLLGGFPKFNPKACRFIDKLNECIGLNLRHALNGGEVEFGGYMVDGYDENQNVIFEYDEPKHNGISKKKRDFIRQQNLIKVAYPALFLRYDEASQRLYDAETKSQIPICI